MPGQNVSPWILGFLILVCILLVWYTSRSNKVPPYPEVRQVPQAPGCPQCPSMQHNYITWNLPTIDYTGLLENYPGPGKTTTEIILNESVQVFPGNDTIAANGTTPASVGQTKTPLTI